MELDTQTIASFGIGLAVGFLAIAVVLPLLSRRLRRRHQSQVAEYQQLIVDLRRERADDRETNRRIRRELAVSTPENFAVTSEERDVAMSEVERLKSELHQSARQLADRDRSLREARLAIHEIRVQLEDGPASGPTRNESALIPAEDPSPSNDTVAGDSAAVMMGDHPVGEATTP